MSCALKIIISLSWVENIQNKFSSFSNALYYCNCLAPTKTKTKKIIQQPKNVQVSELNSTFFFFSSKAKLALTRTVTIIWNILQRLQSSFTRMTYYLFIIAVILPAKLIRFILLYTIDEPARVVDNKSFKGNVNQVSTTTTTTATTTKRAQSQVKWRFLLSKNI